MNKSKIGFELVLNKKEKIKVLKSEKSSFATEYKKFISQKNYKDYIKEFLGSDKNYEIVKKAMDIAMEQALPEETRERNVDYVNYSNKDFEEKNQLRLESFLQMHITYAVAAIEFINIVIENKSVYNDKGILQRLTVDFFKCFTVIEGEGKMFFDLEKMSRLCLLSGFTSISKMLAKSEKLEAFKITNKSLHSLKGDKLHNEISSKEDNCFIDFQIKYFEKEKEFYEAEVLIEERGRLKSRKQTSEKKKPSIVEYVLFYYYLQATRYLPYFENHASGKLAGIKNVLKQGNIKTSPKYFQIAYNKIANHTTNRIAKNQEGKISFVANHMLEDYPKAKELALSELKEAKLKSR